MSRDVLACSDGRLRIGYVRGTAGAGLSHHCHPARRQVTINERKDFTVLIQALERADASNRFNLIHRAFGNPALGACVWMPSLEFETNHVIECCSYKRAAI